MYGLLGQYLDETTIWKSGMLSVQKKNKLLSCPNEVLCNA